MTFVRRRYISRRYVNEINRFQTLLSGDTIYTAYPTTSSRVRNCYTGQEFFVKTYSSPPCPTTYVAFDNLYHFLPKPRVHCEHQEIRAVVKVDKMPADQSNVCFCEYG